MEETEISKTGARKVGLRDGPFEFDEGKGTSSRRPVVFEDIFQIQQGILLPLLLPSYSSHDPVRQSINSFVARVATNSSVYRSLASAKVDADYEAVRDRLAREWQYVGGFSIGLAALEVAAFAVAPGTLFTVDKIVRICVSGSSISTGIGLLCVLYLLFRYSALEPDKFKNATKDAYISYVFFSFTSRLPFLLVIMSACFLATLLGDVAYRLSPHLVLGFSAVIALLMVLQYVIWAVDWVIWTTLTGIRVISMIVNHFVAKIPSPINFFRVASRNFMRMIGRP